MLSARYLGPPGHPGPKEPRAVVDATCDEERLGRGGARPGGGRGGQRHRLTGVGGYGDGGHQPPKRDAGMGAGSHHDWLARTHLTDVPLRDHDLRHDGLDVVDLRDEAAGWDV